MIARALSLVAGGLKRSFSAARRDSARAEAAGDASRGS